jgi:hypothetical protein
MHRAAAGLSDRKRQGGLGQHRSLHRRVDHQCKGEVAGHAHTERADPRPAELLMHLATQLAQPVGDGARATSCEDVKLPRDTAVEHRRDHVPAAHGLIDRPKHLRQKHGEPAVAYDPRKPRHFGCDAWHLVHDDHAGAVAASPDGLRLAVNGHFRAFEIFG